jgi:alkylation response protein AidB-like acyl-CoA dehydrogenase
MTAASGRVLDIALVELGWPDLLASCQTSRSRWRSGCSARPGRTHRFARSHALDRIQFGRPLASFQAVRHRLAETLDGAEATLLAARASESDQDLSCLLAKAAAGQAALTAARHCQQILAGIGFTAEHGLHRHVRRALVLDGLLGSTGELTREAGVLLRKERSAPRLVPL